MILRRLAGGSAALLAAVVVLSAGVTAGTPSSGAGAVDGGGTPGYCPTAEGVTVVVDFQELGGGIVVRCAPGPVVRGYSGLDALQDSGFTPTGVRRYGLAFICRIAGKPTADQELPIQGNPHYQEACVDTPPQQAFWSYWYADNGGSWTYSSSSAISRDAIKGGFEGWSFSLNHATGQEPKPGIAPKRPPQSPPPTTPPSQSPPTHRPPTHQPTDSPPSHQPAQHQGGATSAPSVPPTTAPSMPPTRPGGARSTDGASTTATTPTARAATSSSTPSSVADPVAVGHNSAGEKVTGELPGVADSTNDSARTTVIGLGVVALLVAGGGYVAWRRRVTRE